LHPHEDAGCSTGKPATKSALSILLFLIDSEHSKHPENRSQQPDDEKNNSDSERYMNQTI
jgi:hypothetical protein